MDKNLNLSMGLFFSQRILQALVDKGLKRQKAYEMVQKVAMHCWENKVFFPDAVREDKDICSYLDKPELDDLFDPAYYLKHEELIFSRVFES